MRRQPGFLDVDDRLRRLSDLGNQLEAFGTVVDFEIFRADLVAVRRRLNFQNFTPPERGIIGSDDARAGNARYRAKKEGLEFRPSWFNWRRR